MCGPPAFYLMFIFPQIEPKTCGPPSFYFLKTGWTTRVFLCQICCLLWSFSSEHCDIRVVHLHTIITWLVFLSFLQILLNHEDLFPTGLIRKDIKGKFFPKYFFFIIFEIKKITYKQQLLNKFHLNIGFPAVVRLLFCSLL